MSINVPSNGLSVHLAGLVYMACSGWNSYKHDKDLYTGLSIHSSSILALRPFFSIGIETVEVLQLCFENAHDVAFTHLASEYMHRVKPALRSAWQCGLTEVSLLGNI